MIVAMIWFGICMAFFVIGALAPLWRITEGDDDAHEKR
jgi:hypothetical protein